MAATHHGKEEGAIKKQSSSVAECSQALTIVKEEEDHSTMCQDLEEKGMSSHQLWYLCCNSQKACEYKIPKFITGSLNNAGIVS